MKQHKARIYTQIYGLTPYRAWMLDYPCPHRHLRIHHGGAHRHAVAYHSWRDALDALIAIQWHAEHRLDEIDYYH